MLWNKTPKYGNDDDYADAILAQSSTRSSSESTDARTPRAEPTA